MITKQSDRFDSMMVTQFLLSRADDVLPVVAVHSAEDGDDWIAGMNHELWMMQKMTIWNLYFLLSGKKEFKSNWVFHRKRDSEGRFIPHQALLVPKWLEKDSGSGLRRGFSASGQVLFAPIPPISGYPEELNHFAAGC